MGWSYPHLWSDTRFNKDSELRILILECVFHGIRFRLVNDCPRRPGGYAGISGGKYSGMKRYGVRMT